jgi:nucleoside-triphosphatase THEP1
MALQTISARSQPPASEADPAGIERVPWSVLGPEFVSQWGRPRGKNEPESVQILGPMGSGKGVLQRDILLERARRRESHIVFIATKPADKTTASMGWPVVQDWRGVQRNPQVIFWPRTGKLGVERKQYMAAKIEDLLARLWTPESNTVVVWDELARIESYSRDLVEMVQMYFSEGRALGITNVFGKQRPQGVGRDATANTDWKFAFRANDQADTERVAELFGRKQEYVPVVNSLDRERFEFLVQHKMDMATYISWVDRPVKTPKRR